MCGLFLQHSLSESNSSQNSVASHDLCHSVFGLSHMYAHAADVLHFLLMMYTHLWCANWANYVVAEDYNPTLNSATFSLAYFFFTSLTIYSDTCRLKPFHITVFSCLEEAHQKLLSESELLLLVNVFGVRIIYNFTLW